MNTSLNWIKSLVPGITEVTDEEYRDAMTLSGTKVECFERLDKNLEKIVTGRIVSVERHPDADKLVVCQVDVGESEPVQIVTGAPNVHPGDSGQSVVVVLDGGRVAGGHDGEAPPENGIKIKKGKLRGVESFGMMCALEELGADKDLFPEDPGDGIYIFPDEQEPGSDALALLGLDDTIFEYEITNNRVDCYSVLGVAREAAATFGKEFIPPQVPVTGNGEKASDYVNVEVKDDDLCSRYCARVVKNVNIAPSPEWLKRRLRACGIRPINNIVDITNFVMEEYGQPMHAFDYDTIAGKKIIVERAKDGETFVTLDGNERKLDSDILMICDGEKQIGIAGIMGGENSMITDDVKTLVFESATFDGTNIRKSAKRLSMRTDASGKFEKGLDPEAALEAINRACALVEELGAGEVVGGVIDIYPEPVSKRRIKWEPESYNKLLGTDIDEETMKGYLKPLEIELDETAGELIIPTFRQDLIRGADIAEEIARFYGYDKIPVTLPVGTSLSGAIGGISFDERVKTTVMETAEGEGFSQILTYSFESPKVFDKLLMPESAPLRKTVVISNPLGEDFSIMRTLPVNGMLTSLATNFNRRAPEAKLYELARVYLPGEDPEKLPDERTQLTLGSYGEGDFFDMKGVLENITDALGMDGKLTFAAPDTDYGREAAGDIHAYPFLHPGRQAVVVYEGEKIGYIGELHPAVAEGYDIGANVYLAVIDLNTLQEKDLVSFEEKYTGIANFPAVTRDISMVADKSVPAAVIEDVIAKEAGDLLEECSLFDLYEGEQIEEGKRSLAYNIRFRSKEKTLSDEDINPVMDAIFARLEEKGFELRK